MPRLLAIASGCLLALALIALPGWIAIHRGDAPAPDDRDLRLARAAAPPTDNGYDRFVAAAEAARLPHDAPTWRRFHAFRSGETWEPEWIGELVARNAPATALVRAGLASDAFAFPAPDRAGPRDDRIATLLRLQQIVALAGAQARILLRDGRAADAIELDTLGLRVGKRMSAADNIDLFGIHMASTYQTVSLLDLEHAARRAPLTPVDALALNEQLEATRWRGEDWQRVWALEYERLLGEVDAASTRAGEWRLSAFPFFLLPGAYRWQPHRTATELASLYRDQREKSSHFCADADLRVGPVGLPRPAGFAELLLPNAIGQLALAAVRSLEFDRIQLSRCRFETQVSLVEALLAARAYAGVEGELPERLDQLVPLYLGAVPLDRYDGEPLRYARDRRAVYSIGEDFIDSGSGAAPSLLDPSEPGLSLAF